MQAIVADTTPLNYLVLIQAADILPNLYRTVLIPPAVKAELAHANTRSTPAVLQFILSPARHNPFRQVAGIRFFGGVGNPHVAVEQLPLTKMVR